MKKLDIEIKWLAQGPVATNGKIWVLRPANLAPEFIHSYLSQCDDRQKSKILEGLVTEYI